MLTGRLNLCLYVCSHGTGRKIYSLSFLQVSSLVFAPNYKELVSGHGFAHDKVIIWKYPSLTKVAELEGKFFYFFFTFYSVYIYRTVKENGGHVFLFQDMKTEF